MKKLVISVTLLILFCTINGYAQHQHNEQRYREGLRRDGEMERWRKIWEDSNRAHQDNLNRGSYSGSSSQETEISLKEFEERVSQISGFVLSYSKLTPEQQEQIIEIVRLSDRSAARSFLQEKLAALPSSTTPATTPAPAASSATASAATVTVSGPVIADEAYREKKITSVVIADSVTTIGNSAFAYNQLTSVSIPNSVTSIGNSAFAHNKLINVIIPNSVTSIGKYTFAYNQLTSVTISNRIISIGSEAFSSNQLTNVNIPNSVITIDHHAFNRNQLTKVTIPNSVTTIDQYAFDKNPITEITIGGNVNISSNSFPNNFADFYNEQGKKAGTYILNNGVWSIQ